MSRTRYHQETRPPPTKPAVVAEEVKTATVVAEPVHHEPIVESWWRQLLRTAMPVIIFYRRDR